MTKRQRICAMLLATLAGIGILFGFLPRNWIELRFGMDPDGGSGVLESLLTSIPLAMGVWLASRSLRKSRAAKPLENSDSTATPRV